MSLTLTTARLGRPSRRSGWVTGGTIAALALVLAAGTAGTAQAVAIPITEVQGESVTVPAHSSAASFAVCPAGQTAVSGGWLTSAAGPVPGVSERTSTNATGDSWVVTFDNPTDTDVSAATIVYCSPA